ncbi:MAG TPA: aldolase [Ruminococcaceae bacterium]|nr:aldolase [Oscillospiraceae bacterium]
MSLELMYITNRTDVAALAQRAGVDRIFVDMEYIGKDLRQGGLDTVQSHHTVEDVRELRPILNKSKLLVRCNPIHEASESYSSSEEEIDSVVEAGADIIMLPYFKTASEVEKFIKFVNGRAKTCLLLETAEAAENIDSILSVDGIDEMYIGLNDLHLCYGMDFMFQLLADGTVERLAEKIKAKGISFGFGGVARVGTGTLSADCIFGEHYRLGSDRVILSRAFCDVSKEKSLDDIAEKLISGVRDVRELEKKLANWTPAQFEENRLKTIEGTNKVVEIIRAKKEGK